MIDEKKLIEDLLHNDGIEFQMDFKCSTDEEILHSIQEFSDKLKEGIVNLINAQPKILFGIDLCQKEMIPKRGHWIIRSSGKGANATNYAECSECHVCGSPQWKVCPVCETKMGESQ